MRRYAQLFLLAITVASSAADEASVCSVDCLVREGKAVQALHVLNGNDQALSREEAAYWRGRALITLGRLAEAYDCLQKVPENHALFPYAARGLLYCAKHNPDLNEATLVEKLSKAKDEQTRLLAATALAEQQLSAPENEGSDTSAYTYLQELAQLNEKLQPVVKTLGILLRRKMEDYAGGIEYARALENDPSLNSFMRQLVRLELAELYYAKEKATPRPKDEQAADVNEEEEPDAAGMGEETLLQFIAANPDSPALPEAFRRLRIHHCADRSAYTHSKLEDWAEDTPHARRAAYALLMLMEQDKANGNESATLANRAATDLPGEPLTLTILQEYIRRLILRGEYEQAGLYTDLSESLQTGQSDSYTCFLKALLAQKTPELAAELFRSCAETAGDELRIPALVNALICCMRAGKFGEAEQMITQTLDDRARCALLLTHAEMLPDEKANLARKELHEALNLNPDEGQKVRAVLCELRLSLLNDPEATLHQLEAFSDKERASWSDANELFYAAILEHASDAARPEKGKHANVLLRKLCATASTLTRKSVISLHLADRLSKSGEHTAASDILLELATKQPPGADKAATLLYAGKECSACATLSSLQHAVQLFAECARSESPLAPLAIIEQATVLTRINRCDEALALLEPMAHEKLNAELQARRLTALADAYSFSEGPDHDELSLAASGQILSIPDISHVWTTRAYLQHAFMAARAKSDELALQDYLHVLREHEVDGFPLNEACTFFYYYAGAGAVYRLVCMERFEEAADLAEHIAQWSGSGKSDFPLDPKKSASFRDWARAIRSTHFLPTNILPPESGKSS